MYEGFLKLLNVQRNEASKVFLLLLMGFFIGIFLATLDVGATSLFLRNFSETEDLPLAIVLSGIFGLISTTVYNYFQTRTRFFILGIITLILVISILGAIEFGMQTAADVKTFYFLAFIVMVPFNFLVMLLFWGSFNRLFDVRAAKRIIGSIDTGQLLASIVALFSIPVLLNHPAIGEQELLTLSLLSAGGVFMSFLIIGFFQLRRLSVNRGRISYSGLLANKYISLMAIFVIVSMIAITFIDYSFLSVTTEQFSEDELPTFLSLFEATVVIFSFLFQTFITDKIIALYGLKVSLLINPVLISLLTIGAFLAGTFFGYSAETGVFLFFFMAIAMSKLFVASLKDALDGPSFKLYFLPVDKSIRFDVQTKVEGVITALASLIAGGLIILINRVEIFELIHVTIFTLPLLALWYFITSKMHNGYKDTLQSTLIKNKSENTNSKQREYSIEKVLENEVHDDQDEKVIYGLQLMEKLEPALFENSILKLINSDSPKVRTYALEKMKTLDISDGPRDTIGKLAREAANYSEDSEMISITPERLMRLSKSLKSEDRLLAAKLLRKMISPRNIFVLLELLRDINPRVKFEAIATARKIKRPETWSVLIELLGSSIYSHSAAAALTEAGEKVLPILEAAFHRSGQSSQVMFKIIQIMGRIGGPVAMELLWRKIEYPDKRIVKQILLIYRYMDHQASQSEVKNIMALLESEIGKAMWNMAAVREIPEEKMYGFLHNALDEELQGNLDQIYMLLSILYDPQSVQLVRENIESGTSEGITFALELLDIFISQELKAKLFPLLDDISFDEKLAQLQNFFPREKYNPIQTLNYILNKDYNQVNRWTKACAIHVLAFIPNFRVSKGLIAQLFNPDKLLQEVAAWVIYNKDKNVFNEVAERLPEETRKFLNESIENNKLQEGLSDGFFLRIEMVMYLKSIPLLSNIKGHLLCDLSENMENIVIQNGEIVKFHQQHDDEKIIIVADGEAHIIFEGKDTGLLKKGEILGSLFQHDPIPEMDSLQAKNRAVLFILSINNFYNVMANHHELAQEFLTSIHGNKEKDKY